MKLVQVQPSLGPASVARERRRDSAQSTAVLARVPAVAHDPTRRRPSRRAPEAATGRRSPHRARRRRPVRRAPDRRCRARRDRRAGPRAIAPVGCAQRLRAAARRSASTATAPTGASAARQHVALRAAMALRPLELAQLRERVDDRVRIAADAEARRRADDSFAPGNVPSPRSASVVGARPATAPLAARPATLALRHVRRMHEAPARVDVRLRQQPLDRPHAGSTRSSRRPRASARLRGCASARPAGASRTTWPSSSGVTARRLCGATPST